LCTARFAIAALTACVVVCVPKHFSLAQTNSSLSLQPGIELINHRRWKEAEEFFEKTLSSSHDSIQVLVCLAQVYNAEDKYVKAIPLCTTALSLQSNNIEALTERAEAYLKTKQFQPALKDCKAALESSPQNARLYCIRAEVRAALEQYRNALQDADRAVALAPDSATALCTRANICYKLEEYQRAVSDATAAIRLDGNLADAYYFRGLSYKELGNKPLSKQDMHKARQLGYQD
jgi:tetratricopeptide (TPR) repeat protein